MLMRKLIPYYYKRRILMTPVCFIIRHKTNTMVHVKDYKICTRCGHNLKKIISFKEFSLKRK